MIRPTDTSLADTSLADTSLASAAGVPAKHETAAVTAAPAAGAVPYLSIILNRSVRYAAIVAAAVAFSGLLSPVTARAEQNTGVLTSHRPWLAPAGHRQPRRADVPHDGPYAAREREQLMLDNVFDRSLIICRC
jgi:hypothetical protein